MIKMTFDCSSYKDMKMGAWWYKFDTPTKIVIGGSIVLIGLATLLGYGVYSSYDSTQPLLTVVYTRRSYSSTEPMSTSDI